MKMKKSVVMAFALGALSMLSFNVFASDSSDVEVELPNYSYEYNKDYNYDDYEYREYMRNREHCYEDNRVTNDVPTNRGRGCH